MGSESITISIDYGSAFVSLCRWDGVSLQVEKLPVGPIDTSWTDWIKLLDPVGRYSVIFRGPPQGALQARLRALALYHGARSLRIVWNDSRRSPAVVLVRQAMERHRDFPLCFVEVGARCWHFGAMGPSGKIVFQDHGSISNITSNPGDLPASLAAHLGNSVGDVRTIDSSGRAPLLIAYGGAGPVHAAMLAEALRIDQVLIPHHAGTLAAVGMVIADIEMELRHDVQPQPPDMRVLRHGFGKLMDDAARLVTMEGYDIDDTECVRFALMGWEGSTQRVQVPCELVRDEVHLVQQFHSAGGLPPSDACVPRRLHVFEVGIHVTIATPKPMLPGPAWDVLGQADGAVGPTTLLDRHTTVVLPARWQATAEPRGGIQLVRG